ncbi:hypothetical protein KCP76_16650 [Salmonella enterica subsp. enterica serovar Weltevreden]|nr:hypothetical protein KCP76_16650 [Salmonella enterica subsp. enterica serovar Weltevreden]
MTKTHHSATTSPNVKLSAYHYELRLRAASSNLLHLHDRTRAATLMGISPTQFSRWKISCQFARKHLMRIRRCWTPITPTSDDLPY